MRLGGHVFYHGRTFGLDFHPLSDFGWGGEGGVTFLAIEF